MKWETLQRASRGAFALAALIVLPWAGGADPPAETGAAAAPVAGEWRKLDAVPSRFSRVTDKLGCRWGLNASADVGLSNSADERPNAFERGAVLSINGAEFKASEAEVNEQNHYFRVRGTSDGLNVTREIWIDAERGGARFIETVANPGSTEKKAQVRLATAFGEPFAAVADGEGQSLTSKPGGSAPVIVAATEPPDDPRAGVIWIAADPRTEKKPVLDTAEMKQLSFVWEFVVPPQQSISVLHWMLQRPGLVADQVKGHIQPFLRSGRLVRPKVAKDLAATLVNFSTAGDGDDDSAVTEALLSPLRKLCERLGIERGDEDTYWMSANSQLSGEIQGAPLDIESRFGKLSVPLAEIAAVQGAGGRGRLPRVFLRDGTVVTGPVTLDGWKVVGAKGWTINLTPAALEAVVMRKSPADGPGTRVPGFLTALNSGEVLPLQLAGGQKLALTSPWGAVEIGMDQIVSFHHLKQPQPTCRLWMADGSKLTVFPTDREFSAQSARFGPVTLRVADLTALWQPARNVPDFSGEPEEIASLDGIEGSFCLLKGGNLVAGEIANESLALLSGATETVFKPGDIQHVKRVDGGTDLAPVFHLDLTSGGQFDGVLRLASIKLRTSAGEWDVPVSHLVGIKRSQPVTP